MVRSRVRLLLGFVDVTIRYNYHTTKTVYGSDLASLTDTVASLYTKEKVKHRVRKSNPKQSHAVMALNNFDMCLILTIQRNVWWAILIKYLQMYIIMTQRPFHFSHGNFDAILKMLAHLSAPIFTSTSNYCSLIGHVILLYNFHKYCMIYRLFKE